MQNSLNFQKKRFPMKKTAWVAGASGLIGGHLMTMLCESSVYDKVVALVRKPSNSAWSKHAKAEQWCIDYSALQIPTEARVNDVFCALGSTTKKTPDKKAYYTIDVTYPLNIAEAGLDHGAKFYGLVSAHGAKATSLSYYLKMKGTLESELKNLKYTHLAFARPSLLKGDREEFRLLETMSESLMNLMPGNYKAIDAKDVAAALILAAQKPLSSAAALSSASMQGSANKR
jgi:uncharacterized protein YbjT (DUF2867 family)